LIIQEFTIAKNHPSLSGHFPGEPIVPGAVLLDCIREAIRTTYPQTRISKLLWTKFLNPVAPGQRFIVCLDRRGSRVGFSGKSEGVDILKGHLELARVVGAIGD
jgi:3-hydroxymyristoyl/3-hydroxydecanoyl-(acyl carrier protein) dehydratase